MVEKNGFVEDIKYKRRPSKWANIAAQVLATTAFGCLILSVSTICAMPTIILVKKGSSVSNSNSTNNVSTNINFSTFNSTGFNGSEDDEADSFNAHIKVSAYQESLFGSILFFVQPIGSICSGLIQDTFGRKKCMMSVTIPQLAGWIVLYFATNVETLFFAAIMMGLSIGFMEAPAMSFLGEVIEPRYRGILSTFSEVFLLLGTSFDYLVAGLLPWRTACLVSTAIPILAFFSIVIVPESPTWLLTKGRYRDALNSLCWLRGWVHHEVVRPEYVNLIKYLNIPSGSEGTPLKESEESVPVTRDVRRKENKTPKFLLMTQRRVYEPFFLVMILFFVGHCTSLLGMRPTFYAEYSKLDDTLAESTFFTTMSSMLLTGSLAGAAIIRIIGKRKLIFISLGGTTISCILLAIYAFIQPGYGWVPFTLFIIIGFCSGFGVLPIPWTLTCEVFPQDARGIAAGLAAGCSYLFSGIVIVTYKPIISALTLPVTILIYGLFGFAGLVYMYFMLPETEGKTLAEVEVYFNKEKTLSSPN